MEENSGEDRVVKGGEKGSEQNGVSVKMMEIKSLNEKIRAEKRRYSREYQRIRTIAIEVRDEEESAIETEIKALMRETVAIERGYADLARVVWQSYVCAQDKTRQPSEAAANWCQAVALARATLQNKT